MNIFDLEATISLNLDNFNTNLDHAQKKFKSFSDNISNLSGKIDSAYKGVGDVLSPAVDGFKAVEGVGKKAGNAITTGLKGFAAVSTAVAGFGTAAVKSGAQFDSSMSTVQALSGATGDELTALRNKAIEMGAKTKFSAKEAADAMTYMGMAGWEAEDMLSGIAGVMNLAAASGEDLARTSDIVTDAMSAFMIDQKGFTEDGISNVTHFADVLAAAATSSNTDVGMMGDTFRYVGTAAGTLGYSIEDTAFAVGLMANNGIKATQAGTSLRSILNRLSTNTGATKTQMGALEVLTEKLSVQFYKTDGTARDLNSVLMESREAWKGLTVEQQQYYAKLIAGEEAAGGWKAIMNSTDDSIRKVTESIYDCNGAADEMSKIKLDNLAGDITYLQSAFGSLQIAISDSLTPTLREFAQFGQKAMASLLEGFQGGGTIGFMSALEGVISDGIIMLSQKAPDFARVSSMFVLTLANGILDSKDEIVKAANSVINILIEPLDEWLLNEGANELADFGFEIVDTIFGGFSKAGALISDHIGAFIPLIAEAFLSYHETLFTVGMDILGAIGQGIIDNKDQLQSIASETITNMVTALRDNAPAIIEGGLALLEALVGAIEENMPLILETGAVIIGKLIEGISTASPGVQAIIATAVLPHILKIVDTVGKIGGAVSSVAGVVGSAINTVIGIGSKLMVGIKALFALITAHPVIAIITGIVAAVTLLWTHCEGFRDAVKGILEAIGGFFKTAYEVITGTFAGAVDFFGGIVNGIKSAFDGIGEFLGGLFTAAWDLVKGAWDVAVGFFTEIGDGIRAVFEAVTSFLGDVFSAAWDLISGIWSAAVGFFSKIWDGISAAGKKAGEAVGKALTSAWDTVKKAWNGAMGFFSGVRDKIVGVFSNIGGKFMDIGKNIVDGIKNGISNAWSSFMSWLNSKVGGIIDGVKAMLGIHSPSTVFAGIGENMALGLAEGWDDQYSSIKRQIENGMSFAPMSVGVTGTYNGASGAYNPHRTGQGNGQFNSGGSFTVNIYNPEKRDAVTEAREWKKTAQRMAVAYG